MIRYDDAFELHFTQRLHDLVHVEVAVVYERLAELRQRGTHIAEVHFENLALRPERQHSFHRIFAEGLPSAFAPGPDAKAHAEVVAAGDLECPLVSGVGPESARHAAERCHWRIVGMKPDPH